MLHHAGRSQDDRGDLTIVNIAQQPASANLSGGFVLGRGW
jgi:hypothetical protein